MPHYWAHVCWVWGAKDIDDFMRIAEKVHLEGILDRIHVPFLVTHGEKDSQIPLQWAHRTYEQLVNSPKRELKVFTDREGGIPALQLRQQHQCRPVHRRLGCRGPGRPDVRHRKQHPQSRIMTNRRILLSAAAAFALTGRSWAQGKAFPDHPVRLVVPNPPGGPSDIVARFLAESMRSELGQSLIVDNRPGAAGLIGTAAAATAPADGYTVLVTSRSNHVMAPLVQKTTQVDPQRDLVPVGLAIRAVGMLATNSKAPFKTFKDLIAYAKANPGKLFYGSAGIGATNHIAIEQFKSLAGIDVTSPYKGSGLADHGPHGW